MDTHPRQSPMLILGAKPENWQFYRSTVKSGLQSMHMGWVCAVSFADTVEQALARIKVCGDLKIVSITNEDKRSPEVLEKDALAIAERLSAHPQKPWISLAHPSVEHLKDIFETRGLRVINGLSCDVVHARWESEFAQPQAA